MPFIPTKGGGSGGGSGGDFIPTAQKGAANGVATLNASTKIPFLQIDSATATDVENLNFTKFLHGANASQTIPVNAPRKGVIPTEKAMADYVAAVTTGLLKLVGTWQPVGQFPASLVSSAGDTFIVTGLSGTVDGVNFDIGDKIAALVENPSATTYANNWVKFDNVDDVTTVFGRKGVVVAEAGDYNATQVTNTPSGNITSVNVQNAINELDTGKISNTIVTAKGSLIGATASGSPVNIPAGTDGELLVYDSAQASGFSKTRIISSVVFSEGFDGTNDITIYDDPSSFTLRYNAAELQFQFRPNVALTRCNTSILININNQIRDRTDDFNVATNTWYYFANGSNKVNNFNMQDFGIQFQMHVSKEVRQIGIPSVYIQGGIGNPDNIWAIVNVVETK